VGYALLTFLLEAVSYQAFGWQLKVKNEG